MPTTDPFKLNVDINQDFDVITNMTAENEGLIINVKDILSKSANATLKNIVESIALKPTCLGHKIYLPGQKAFASKKTGKSGNAGTVYAEEIPIYLLGNTPENAAIVDIMGKDARFIIIRKQAAKKGTNAYYEILGYECGLVADASTLDTYGADGGWSVTLKSENNSKSAYFLYATDAESTETLFDSLLVAAT